MVKMNTHVSRKMLLYIIKLLTFLRRKSCDFSVINILASAAVNDILLPSIQLKYLLFSKLFFLSGTV